VFEKEYADMNWYKGKQAKHTKEMEMGQKRSKLGELLLLAPSIGSQTNFISLAYQ
jgi:hypothetical protein